MIASWVEEQELAGVDWAASYSEGGFLDGHQFTADVVAYLEHPNMDALDRICSVYFYPLAKKVLITFLRTENFSGNKTEMIQDMAVSMLMAIGKFKPESTSAFNFFTAVSRNYMCQLFRDENKHIVGYAKLLHHLEDPNNVFGLRGIVQVSTQPDYDELDLELADCEGSYGLAL